MRTDLAMKKPCTSVCVWTRECEFVYLVLNRYLLHHTTVDLMKAWEDTKIQFDPSEMQDDAATPVRLNLAALVGEGILGERSLKSCVDAYNSRYGGGLILKRGTTILMPLLQASSLFMKVINKITTLVRELLDEKPMQYIYLVGGFAESKMLQARVKTEFEGRYRGLRVIVPMRPQLMVVKGAVLFGLQKGSTIQSRVARSTYGFDTGIEYQPSNPDHVRRGFRWITRNGVQRRYVKVNRFRPLVKKGDKIRVSDTHSEHGFVPLGDDQTEVCFTLYSSTNPTACFADEPGMKDIGRVTVPCVRGQCSGVAMSFGNTEILATAKNESTGVVHNAQISFNFNNL